MGRQRRRWPPARPAQPRAAQAPRPGQDGASGPPGAGLAVVARLRAAQLEAAGAPEVDLGQYPIVTPVRGELKKNRTYGLSVSWFYF
jgi:hypothetical protein